MIMNYKHTKIYWISNNISPSSVPNCNANDEVDGIQNNVNNQRNTFFICQNIDQFESVKEDRQTLLNQTLWKDDRAKNVARTKHGDDNVDDYVKIDDDDDDDGGDNDEDVKIAKLVLWRRQRASYEEELFFQSHRGYWSLLESWSSLGHHFFVVLVILVIENSSKSRGRQNSKHQSWT